MQCRYCGVLLKNWQGRCPSCGRLGGHTKARVALAALFLGRIGVHNFMMGEKRKGIFKILTSPTGLSAWLSLFDLIRILCNTYCPNPKKFF